MIASLRRADARMSVGKLLGTRLENISAVSLSEKLRIIQLCVAQRITGFRGDLPGALAHPLRLMEFAGMTPERH